MDNNLNALRQFMDFYNQQGMGPREMTHTGFNPTQFDRQGMAADWAASMLERLNGGRGGQAPDFFGASGGGMGGQGGGMGGGFQREQYVPPTATAPNPIPMDSLPTMQQAQPRMAPITNYLRQILGGDRQIQPMSTIGIRG